MTRFELTEITTRDNLIHQGIVSVPEKAGTKAVLWVHGLTGKFYGNTALINTLADTFTKHGIAFASFNNRGHDIMTGISTVDPNEPSGKGHLTGGASYERFEDSVHDIDAGVRFLRERGYAHVFLAGHSSGANKVCYYAGTIPDANIAGVILAGPLSDRYSPNVDRAEYENNITTLTMLRGDGKGDSLLTKVNWFPLTADRAWSLIAPNTPEDVFNYGDTEHVLTTFSNITKPTLVIFSGSDEYADRPVRDIQSVFDQKTKAKHYQSVVIPATTHSMEGKEREFANALQSWIASLP